MIVIGLSGAFAFLLPQLFGARLGGHRADAQWVVFFLGTGLGVQMALAAFNGVLTGCHRWELHNVIKSGWYAATVVGMIVALLCGGGLRGLATITFAGMVLDAATHVILAYKVCEGLRLRPSLIGRPTIKQLFVFGGKTLIPSVSNLLLSQTTSVLILAYLGPAALALYTRPHSLIRHINTLINKMAFVLTPTASSLQSRGNVKEIGELLTTSVRYSLYVVLPLVLVLVIFGGPILQLWMGPRYANGLIAAILAIGYLATLAQTPILSILGGMNAHGRAGIAQLVASLCSVGLTVLAVGYLRWGILGAAVAVTVPLTVINTVYLPYLVCRCVGLKVGSYFRSIAFAPAIHVLPFAVSLLVARLVFNDEPLKGLACGLGVGGMILAALYWGYVLPERIKMRVLGLISPGGSVA
ncbi:MAG: hypothetical protein A2Z25_06085 [Planctomycetes bacterium RBG_16_55_9]|nr:MAG: hypothetical protein A2Z25_06085 [Planctomycetes bacterium RBG_16_55_9]